MRKAVDTLVGVVIGFVVTFLLNAAVSYSTQPNALVTTGAVAVGSQWYASLEVENYSERTIDGLRLVLPASIRLQNVTAVPPVRITSVASTVAGGMTRVEISAVEPRAITRILIPIASRTDADDLVVSNAAEKNVGMRTSDQIETRLQNAVSYAVRTALIYAVIAGIGSWLFARWLDAKYAQIAEHRKALARAEENIEKLHAEINTVRREAASTASRVKILLVARLADLAKELSFWRRTVRDLLIQSGADKRDVRELTDSITRSLKTFWASRGEYEADLEALKVAAALIDKEK